MKRVLAWLVTVFVVYLIFVFTYRFYLYNLVYKSVSGPIEKVVVSDYSYGTNEYMPFFKNISLSKEYYDSIDMDTCKIDEHRIICDDKILVSFFNVEEDYDGYDILPYIYKLNTSDVSAYLKKMGNGSREDGYFAIFKEGSSKINFFSKISLIKEEIMKKHIANSGFKDVKLFDGDLKLIAYKYDSCFVVFENDDITVRTVFIDKDKCDINGLIKLEK